MYKPKYYTLSELAHPQIIRTIGEKNTWRRLDDDCLRDLDTIRELWGSGIYVNRLDLGLDSRGLRPPNDPDGSFYSTHKQGTTFDLDPVINSNGEHLKLYNFIIKLIKNNKLIAFNTLEDFKFTPTWVHVAKMNVEDKPLIIQL